MRSDFESTQLCRYTAFSPGQLLLNKHFAMTETHPPITTPSFTETEISQFKKDDLTAGKFIGRTLVLIFLYSAVIMGGVIWWTQTNIAERNQTNTSGTITEQN